MDWKLTATKLYCDTVDQWITVIVYKDGSVKCSYYERKTASAKGRGRAPCSGYDKCPVLSSYREDVFQRERQGSNS
ncbi:MAG: hypothetical protein R6X08_00665 [Desulfosalsimonadaceae bacterium]